MFSPGELCASQLQKQFGWEAELIEKLTLNAIKASLLTVEQKQKMFDVFQTEFIKLRSQYIN